jgi:hypothetical protein
MAGDVVHSEQVLIHRPPGQQRLRRPLRGAAPGLPRPTGEPVTCRVMQDRAPSRAVWSADVPALLLGTVLLQGRNRSMLSQASQPRGSVASWQNTQGAQGAVQHDWWN